MPKKKPLRVQPASTPIKPATSPAKGKKETPKASPRKRRGTIDKTKRLHDERGRFKKKPKAPPKLKYPLQPIQVFATSLVAVCVDYIDTGRNVILQFFDSQIDVSSAGEFDKFSDFVGVLVNDAVETLEKKQKASGGYLDKSIIFIMQQVSADAVILRLNNTIINEKLGIKYIDKKFNQFY